MRHNLIGAHVPVPSKGGVYLVGLSATDATFLSEKPRQREDNVDLASFHLAFVWLKADPLKTLLD
jgi:hypothetical protein